MHCVTIPLWIPAAALGVSSTLLWRRHWGRRRGVCPACNYALTGLAPGSPCPECGKRGSDAVKT
ncbi:hypothetical protein PHYC_00134 [Phycisphaerales bacterium]|nr:hypothetical protein PHYC_00134 [Phycisphaerales bacterium]